jgi:hypothetical protein
MKKPVRKVRGYAEGGKVNEPSDSGVGLMQMKDRAPDTAETKARYRAARDALDSAHGNIYPDANKGAAYDPLAASKYPGFRRGGPVKKVAKKVVRKR